MLNDGQHELCSSRRSPEGCCAGDEAEEAMIVVHRVAVAEGGRSSHRR